MKTKIVAAFVAILITSAAVVPQSPSAGRAVEVTANYDKKKDLTTLYLGPLTLWKQPIMQELTLAVSFDFPKRTITKPKEVLFGFQALSNESLMFPTMTFSVVVDDQRLDFGKMTGDWKGPSGGLMIEKLRMPVSYENFAQIVAGKKVTLIVAERNYDLSAEQMRALRGFHQVMQREGQQVQ